MKFSKIIEKERKRKHRKTLKLLNRAMRLQRKFPRGSLQDMALRDLEDYLLSTIK